MDRRPMISVIVPTLNEAGNVVTLYERVRAVFESRLRQYDWEMVVTDNHSSDETFAELLSIAAGDSRLRAYRFSKNFGFQQSIFAGYLLSQGDAVVQLDADMQDPPELIPELVERWENGAQVVYGIRRTRPNESKMLTAARKFFYRLIDWLSDERLPHDAGDFRLVDRVVVEVLRHSSDASPYLRGAIASMGFEQIGFEYERDERSSGETKFNMSSLLRLGFDGIMNHSTRPLNLASMTALGVVVIAIAAIACYVAARVFFEQDWPAGFVTLALLQLVGIVLNAAFLGIIGAYLGRIFKQTRKAPLVIVSESSRPHDSATVLTSGEWMQVQPLAAHNDAEARNQEQV